jgi:predicted transcriptional regulator
MSPPAKDSQVSLRLPGELKDRVEIYAAMTGRSKSHVAMEALAEYLDWRLPQVADLKEAIAAADRGEFASDNEVGAVLARYADPAAAAPPPGRA